MARGKSWRLRMCLVLLGPLVFTLALEGTARLWLGSRGEEFSNQFWLVDPELGARVRPGFVGLDDRGLAVEINSRGLRNPELDTEPDPARPLRSYGLSESFDVGDPVEHKTFGTGVVELVLEDRKIQVFFPVGRKVLAHQRF